MAIQLRKPEQGEERLSWCRGVDVEICTDDGRQKGKLDFQFHILPPSDIDEELNSADQSKTYEFVKRVLRSVSGLYEKDEDKKRVDWDPDDQLDFVLLAPELVMSAFRSYFKHISSGDARKKG